MCSAVGKCCAIAVTIMVLFAWVCGADEVTAREQALLDTVQQLLEANQRLEARVEQLEKHIGLSQSEQETPEKPASPVPATDTSAKELPTSTTAPVPPPHASAKDKIALETYWKRGLWFESTDKAYSVHIGGRIQTDCAWFDSPRTFRFLQGNTLLPQVSEEEDGVEFRRARLQVSARIYDDYIFKAQYDFAGDSGTTSFKDVYVGMCNVPYVGTIKLGHLQEPFGLDELISNNDRTFMEIALLNAFIPDRNYGLLLSNQVLNKRLNWALGVFHTTDNNPGDNDSQEDTGWNVTGRLTGVTWYDKETGRRVLHLGCAFSHRDPDGMLRYRQRPEAHLANVYLDTRRYNSDGSYRDINADAVNLYALEAALQCGPVSVQGEYMRSEVTPFDGAGLDFDGWYVQASYFLTGEHRPYSLNSGIFGRVVPNHSFSLQGERGWGAWELALRYSELNLNDSMVYGGSENNVGVGINWYLNGNARIMLNYIHADITDVLYHGDVDILQSRFQVSF